MAAGMSEGASSISDRLRKGNGGVSNAHDIRFSSAKLAQREKEKTWRGNVYRGMFLPRRPSKVPSRQEERTDERKGQRTLGRLERRRRTGTKKVALRGKTEASENSV